MSGGGMSIRARHSMPTKIRERVPRPSLASTEYMGPFLFALAAAV